MATSISVKEVVPTARKIEDLALVLNNKLETLTCPYLCPLAVKNIEEFIDDELKSVSSLIERLAKESSDKLSPYETYVSFLPSLTSYLTRLLSRYFLEAVWGANVLQSPESNFTVSVTIDECHPLDKDVKYKYLYSGLALDINVKVLRTFKGKFDETVTDYLSKLRSESYGLRANELRFVEDEIYSVISSINKGEKTTVQIVDELIDKN